MLEPYLTDPIAVLLCERGDVLDSHDSDRHQHAQGRRAMNHMKLIRDLRGTGSAYAMAAHVIADATQVLAQTPAYGRHAAWLSPEVD